MKASRHEAQTTAVRRSYISGCSDMGRPSAFCKVFIFVLGFLLYVFTFSLCISTHDLDTLPSMTEICPPMSPLCEGIFI